MKYWLVKTEPGEWSWKNQIDIFPKSDPWTGVRNYQARNNLRAMEMGDLAFFYHSINEKQIVGVVEVTKTHYTDPEDIRFSLVDFKAKYAFKKPITLAMIKENPDWSNVALIKQTRLSVMPIETAVAKEWLKFGDYEEV